MISGWDAAEAETKQALQGGGLFMRLANDGDTAQVVFCGEPLLRRVHWTGTAYEDCKKSGCQFCAEGNRSTVRVSLNVYSIADKSMKIMEGGSMWFQNIVENRNKYATAKRPFKDCIFEMKRSGAAGSTKTTYSTFYEETVDEETRKRIASTPLHNLGAKDVRDTIDREARESAIAPSPTQAASIDVEAAREIHGHLKKLKGPEVEGFMTHFGVSRITELKASQEEEARQWITDLMVKF